MRWLALAMILPAGLAMAEPDHAAIAERALGAHILPAMERLADATEGLAGAAAEGCAGGDMALVRESYHAAYAAWAGAGHLNFGPLEEDGRGFAIAFWPDTRGSAGRSLARLIAEEDPVVDDPAAFRKVSVAARGLTAMERLIFDGEPPAPGSYECRLLAAIGADLAATARAVLARWRDPYAAHLRSAGEAGNPLYLAREESTRALYQALMTGFEVNADLRLGRPLGKFERPRPTRAEAWRSGRSLDNIAISVAALHELARAAFWPEIDQAERAALDAGFARVLEVAGRIEVPLHEAVADPARRIRVEALQSALGELGRDLSEVLRARLGVTAGFNALDGD